MSDSALGAFTGGPPHNYTMHINEVAHSLHMDRSLPRLCLSLFCPSSSSSTTYVALFLLNLSHLLVETLYLSVVYCRIEVIPPAPLYERLELGLHPIKQEIKGAAEFKINK